MNKGRVTRSDVVKACQKGIVNAQKQYAEMAGEPMWYGPEYFITTHIAQSLNKAAGSKFITLENSAYYGLQDANALGKGTLHSDLRSNGRFDILLWWANELPRAVIEVKNRVYNKTQYESDIKRIKQTLERKSESSSLEFGVFSFYTLAYDSEIKENSGKQTLESRLSTIESRISDMVGANFNIEMARHIKYCDVGEVYWAAASVIITRA